MEYGVGACLDGTYGGRWKLTNVARASLEELRLDYEDFLRQRGLAQWDDCEPLGRELVQNEDEIERVVGADLCVCPEREGAHAGAPLRAPGMARSVRTGAGTELIPGSETWALATGERKRTGK